VSLSKQQTNAVSAQDSLLHGKALLVISSRNAESVTLKLNMLSFVAIFVFFSP